MIKKVKKWAGLCISLFAVSAVVMTIPTLTSCTSQNNDNDSNNDNLDSDSEYKIPANLGSKVADSAFAYGEEADRVSTNIVDNQRFLDTIEGTYVFAGGNDFFSGWDTYQSYKSIVGLFEENVRWTLTSRSDQNPSEVYSSLGRFCINVSKPNQTLKEINDKYDFKVKNLDPRNVVTIVGSEYINTVDIDKTLDQFESDLRVFVQNSLKLRSNNSNLILIKHWKIPNPNNDATITNYNNNVEKLNLRVNKILSELTANQIPRVLLVDDENLFLNLDWQNNAYFDGDLNLTRIGNNEVAKSIIATMKPYLRTTGQIWNDTNWTDFSRTQTNNVPFEYSTLKMKNGLDISLSESTKVENNQTIATLTISFPNGGVSPGDKLKWLIKFDNPMTRIEDYSVVNDNNQIVIDNIFVNPASTTVTNTNTYSLIVYDKDDHPFNLVNGDLSQSTQTTDSLTTTANATKNWTTAQKKFMDKFNDLTKPMVWMFLGDSIEHGCFANQGFDGVTEVTEKSVKNDWKRYDDIFINAAQSGNFTNRAVNPYQIAETFTKYKADVVSIGIGVSDGVRLIANGESTYTDEAHFIANMKTLINAAKAANPDVVIVINAINPCTMDRHQSIPPVYNAYLKKAFGSTNEYSDCVIYDEDVYNELEYVTTHYTYTQNDDLFMYQDRLHPSGLANIVKSRNFLKSLGVNIENSYLTNYMLERFSWWTGNDTNPVNAMTSVAQGNKVVPDIKTWSSTYPLGGAISSSNNLANVFLRYKSNTSDSERTYYLTTDYGDYSNKYLLYLQNGSYDVDAWAISKTPLSTLAQYAAKAPTATLVVSNSTTS